MRIIPLSKMIIMPFIVFILVPPFTRAVEIDFNRQIRPILSENCFQCHGPDQTHRKGNYRLDTKEGIFAVGKSGLISFSVGTLSVEAVVFNPVFSRLRRLYFS